MTSAVGRSGPNAAGIAYQAMAPVYDDFTCNHDYDLWLGSLLPALERHGIPGRRLLDVACGTGKSCMPMVEGGWVVTACDVAPAMIEIAKRKAEGMSVRFAVSDMRRLPTFGEFDVVWCLDDAVNYLLSTAELMRSFQGMRKNMGQNALLVFDLNTLHSFRTFFVERHEVENSTARMIWTGLGDPHAEPETVAEARFEVEFREPHVGPPIAPQIHRQRHFPEAVVIGALQGAGLETVAVHGHHYDAVLHQPLDEDKHTKAIYIARKRA